MRRMSILAGIGFLVPIAATFAQGVSSPSPSCDVVMKDPAAVVGQSVSFYGSLTGADFRPINGKQDIVNEWECKDKGGGVLAGGEFAFLSSEASFTDAAGKADTTKSLFVVTGKVRDPKLAPSGLGSIPPLLTEVHVKLASETR